MTDQQQIKEIIKQEYIKCATDPIHFFRKYCYITHPMKGRVLFHLYPFQADTLQEIRDNRFSIINKSRQLGISTLVAGYSLWIMLFHKDKTILCIATKQETAKGMVDKVQFMYNNLPSWLRGNQKPETNNKLSLKLPNNSQIVATSAASDAGRSYAVSLLLVDEAAFIEGIDKIYTSIKPTIATGGGIIALSSPNGVGNWFHKMYTLAEQGKGDFKPIKLPWNLHPDRVAPIDPGWEERERANMSPREFAQEYDCDFLGSGNTVVDSNMLSFYEQTYIQDPIEKRLMGGDLWIWQYPDYSKTYIVSADVARGDATDYSTFHVIDLENCEQVAEYKSQVSTREFGHVLVSIASEYNNAAAIVSIPKTYDVISIMFFLKFNMSKNSCTCTPEWIRTTNTRIWNPMLYQLELQTHVRVTGIEPITFRVSGGCSNQLSYTRIVELVKPTLRQGNSVQCFLRSPTGNRTPLSRMKT